MNRTIESLFIEVICPASHTNNIIVGVIYRPPNGNILNFTSAIREILKEISPKKRKCYLIGDFNIDFNRYHLSPDTAEFFNLLYSHSFTPLIDKSTRVSSSSSTIIDNIFTNQLTINHKSGVIQADISDHYPIFAISEITSPVDMNKKIKFRSFKQRNVDRFTVTLREESWENVYSSDNAQTAYSAFADSLASHYDRVFPIIERKQTKRDSNHWITRGLKTSIKHKNKLYIRYKNSPTLQNSTTYKHYKNRLRSLIGAAKKLHYEHLITANKNKPKEIWDIIKEVVGNKNSKYEIDEIVIDNKTCNDKQKITDAFNEYFINIGPNLAKDFPSSNTQHLDYMGTPNINSMYLTPTNPTEVINCLLKLKRSAPGIDELNPTIIKQIATLITNPLTYAFNLCFEQGIVPDELKIARVSPIPKKGDPLQPQNYRPISILPVFSKIFERLLYNRIYSFLHLNNILNSNQFGFRNGYSTEMALASFVEKITSALDKGQHTIGVFLDLKKAFDTVNFPILLDKLNHIGIRGKSLELIKSYLTNRKQAVTISSFKSDYKGILCGVPQGSILGPLLFLIYINDLPNALESSFPIMYADDTNIFHSGDKLPEVENSLNRDLNSLSTWLSVNKLSLNLTKTHTMLFTLNNHIKLHKPKLKMNNIELESTNSTTFLGVIIDQTFTWSKHLTHLASKLSKSIGILKKASHAFNKSTLRMLYYSFLQPYFNYCILVWGNTADCHLQKLKILQKRAIRIISGAHFLAHTTDLFAFHKTLKLNDLYLKRIALFSYKLYSNQFPTTFTDEFATAVLNHTHNTRSMTQRSLQTPLCRTTQKQKTLKYQSIKIYNEFLLPNNYHSFTSVNALKNAITKKFLLTYA